MADNKSKIHKYGGDCESDWPSQYGTRERGIFHIDRDTGEATAGYPPQRHETHGQAPMVLFDSMPKTYHEGIGRQIESRKEWEQADRESGCVTFGSKESAKPTLTDQKKLQIRKADSKQAILETCKMYEQNPEVVKGKAAAIRKEQKESAKRNGFSKTYEKVADE